MAEGLRQPFSVHPVGFDYNRYLQEDSPSPSDQAPPVVNAEPSQPAPAHHGAPAPVAQSSGATGANCGACDSGCDTCGAADGCDSCGGCASCGSCGCGLNLHCLGCMCAGEAHTLQDLLLCDDSCVTIGGWTQFGYTDESDGLFNDQPNNINLHQQWFYVEKLAKADACNWDWGFRGDIMYGIDGADTQAFGNTFDPVTGTPRGWDTGWNHGIYGFAVPQLYGEIARGDWSLKAGHFYTPVGYESVMAPNNFFYSHALTMYNSEPFTHTGALATYTVSENLKGYIGWSLGWDTGFDQFEDGNSYIGGFTATLSDNFTATYIHMLGDFGWRGDEAYVHSVVLDTKLTDNLKYVFQTDYLRVEETGEDNTAIVQYLLYTVNDCFGLGTRVEWWKTDPLIAGAGSLSFNEVTFGANFKPHANLVLRPEVRQDWSPALDFDETILGVDVIAKY
jgi:hypothetical protein